MSDNGYNNNDENVEEFSEESLREIAKEVVQRRIGLQNHLRVYIFVNILLFIINYLTFPLYRWHMWPLLGWGIGLGYHIFGYITFRRGSFGDDAKAGISYHVFTYLIVCAFLFWIDFLFTGTMTWSFFPIGGWGLALVIHLYVYITNRPKTGDDPRKSYLDREIDKELSKIRKN